MLNDIATATRLQVAAFGLCSGLFLGIPVVGTDVGAVVVLCAVALVIEIGAAIGFLVYLKRADARLWTAVTRGSGELVSGAVPAVPAVGRVVRRRVDGVRPWFLPGRGSGPGPTALTVVTALPSDGTPARRVAVALPADLGAPGGLGRGTPAVLLLHPHEREVAVLDDRVDQGRLAEVAADPRWRSERLPTDRRVVGGYLALLAATVAGMAVGVLVGYLVSLLG